jgi:hypothetical protein
MVFFGLTKDIYCVNAFLENSTIYI